MAMSLERRYAAALHFRASEVINGVLSPLMAVAGLSNMARCIMSGAHPGDHS